VIEHGRRALLLSLAAGALDCARHRVLGESRGEEPVGPGPEFASADASGSTGDAGDDAWRVTRRELAFDKTPVGAERAVVLVPAWAGAGEQLPVLIALHGRGESVRGAQAGAYGWVRDYNVERTIARLRTPPLKPRDFLGFVDETRLQAMNAALDRQAYRGLIVVCPWVPDLIGAERAGTDLSPGFAQFVVEQLLPRVLEETPALPDPAATGIDGVSLGGRAALLVGLKYPERFGALGTLQPAVHSSEASELALALATARTRSPALKIRLLTSDADYFRGDVAALHSELDRSGVPHEHLVVRGPHDYPFNRGPGGIEMLLWHDRVLRGQPPV
jgi:iron(III)-salmochelin esterase